MRGLKILFVLLTVAFGLKAQYSAEGGTVSTIANGQSWSNVGNAISDDNNRATVSLSSSNNLSDYVAVSNFGFAVGSGETISGIEVTANVSQTNVFSYVADGGVYLMKGGSIVGSNRGTAVPFALWDINYNYGGAADLWGTSWTPADVNSSGFGVAIATRYFFGLGGSTARIDNVLITISTTVPLPVELTYFEIADIDGGVQLDWTTNSEIENDYFEVQKSNDGFVWQTISQLDGKGNTIEVTDYEFTDKEPQMGMNYYRLKQVDFDGTTAYSDVEVIEKFEAPEVIMYPNPTTEAVMFKNLPEGDNNVEVFNSSGQLVINEPIMNHRPLVTNFLKPGYYIVKLSTGLSVSTQKLIIK